MNFVGINCGTSPEAAYEALSLASVMDARTPDRIAIPRLPCSTSQLFILMGNAGIHTAAQEREGHVIRCSHIQFQK